ncbi:MAG: hypothetical protein PHY31_04830 [Smithellaceae bacterium]|nr:hypothetical protein [Smithellaceae bacterium]
MSPERILPSAVIVSIPVKEFSQMTYSFSCPVPCRKEIKVEASDENDAVAKIVAAGALRCRNAAQDLSCRWGSPDMPPLHEERIRSIVRLCMREQWEIGYDDDSEEPVEGFGGERRSALAAGA